MITEFNLNRVGRWRGGGFRDGQLIRFISGKFSGRIGHIDRLSGDCFYYVTDPLNGERIHGYAADFEELPDDHWCSGN